MTTRQLVVRTAESLLARGPGCCLHAAPGYDLTKVSWCQIFWLHCLREAGLTTKTWADLARSGWVAGWLPRTDDPQPGDLAYIDQPFQHGAVVQMVDREGVHTIDGNSPGGIVAFRTRPKSAFTAFYSIGPLIAAKMAEDVSKVKLPPDKAAQFVDGVTAIREVLDEEFPVVRGVDVSAWQHPDTVDWPLLRSLGYSFAYVRTVKMGRTVDVYAAEHIKRARDAGLSVGPYGFFHPDVKAEIHLETMQESFIKCGIHPGDLAPALDIESIDGGPKAKPSWVADALWILGRFRFHWGQAVRYHNVADWHRLGRPAELEAYPLWLADYTPPADLPCAIWQHRSAKVKGTNMTLDQNIAHADLPRIGHPTEAVVAAPRLVEP